MPERKGKKSKEGTHLVKCAYCRGTGRDPNTILSERPCPVCKGKGQVRV